MEEASSLAERIVADARGELAEIVAHHLLIEAQAGRGEAAQGVSGEQILAIGRGIAPLAAAAVLLAALPALATTTTVTVFGLVTTSTVSLPILALGGAGVGALSYLK
jgi:hypothetical protein